METEHDAPAAGEHSYRLVITHAHNVRFAARFGVDLATVWGMTETGALCVGSEPGYGGELGANYVGTPMEGVEIGVFDDELRPVPRGERGEIALRHRNVMLGYLKDPEATAQTLVDGWVRSGDQGTLDEDGRLFFVGRIKNVIKRSGENVSAEEVEEVLAAHPGVAECTVVRRARPAAHRGGRRGRRPRRQRRAVDPAGLRDGCAARLVRWKLPRYISLTDEPLPRLATASSTASPCAAHSTSPGPGTPTATRRTRSARASPRLSTRHARDHGRDRLRDDRDVEPDRPVSR